MKTIILHLLLFPILCFGQLDYHKTIANIKLEESILYHDGTKKLYPSVIGGIKITKTGFALLSFGMVPQVRQPFLLFSTSSQKVSNQKFEFDFGVPLQNELYVEDFDRYFRGAKSPKEFLLIRLDKNERKNRRYILKEKGTWGNRKIASAIAFSFSEIESGLFLVEPNKPLPAGEYCFVHQDVLNAGVFKDFAFFDFTIE